MESYHQAEQNLLFGILDALPCPAALLNRTGETAYVNPKGESCVPSLDRCAFSSLASVQACLRGESPPASWITIPANASEDAEDSEGEDAVPPLRSLSGLLEVYPIKVDDILLGVLLMLRPEVKRSDDYDMLPYVSTAMEPLRERMTRLSFMGVPALFLGENGTGRAAFARALHNMGPLADAPFTMVPCRMDDPNALDQLLFGEIAHPGALRQLSGAVFLHNVDSLPLPLQHRLATLMQSREFPDGMPLLARISASGPPDMSSLVELGQFDATLYARLSVMPIRIPPLRERTEDILPLAEHFLRRFAAMAGHPDLKFTGEAKHALLHYDWPGNIRELEDAILSAVGRCQEDAVDAKHLPFSANDSTLGLHQMRVGFVQRRIDDALAVHGYTVEGKRRAASELGIGLSTLYRLMNKSHQDSSPSQ